jgi:hypothetical protein
MLLRQDTCTLARPQKTLALTNLTFPHKLVEYTTYGQRYYFLIIASTVVAMGYAEGYTALVEDHDQEKYAPYVSKGRREKLKDRLTALIMVFLLLLSLSYNGFQAHNLMMEKARPDQCRSKFSMSSLNGNPLQMLITSKAA